MQYLARFGPAEPVAELNSAAMDIQPNVRGDGREIVFASNCGGATAFGGQDIWVATRTDVNGPWSAPVNLGSAVNTLANETRPSLAWGATRLYFSRALGMPVTADIWVSTREKDRRLALDQTSGLRPQRAFGAFGVAGR